LAGLTGSRFAWKQNIKIDIILLLSDERELKNAARKAFDAFALRHQPLAQYLRLIT
jgi:hypothetical protein